MQRETLLKIACVLAALALPIIVGGTGCGQAESKSLSQIALEESETILVGRSLFAQVRPNALSPKQRRLLARLLGGEWLGNGLFIPAERVETDCQVKLLPRETCRARPSRPDEEGSIGGPQVGEGNIGGVSLR